MSPLDACEMEFGLGDTLLEVRTQVRSFARKEIAPLADGIDRSNEFPRALWPKLGALGPVAPWDCPSGRTPTYA
jgi:isovaleryl-CoA dehydrogenase